MTEWEAEIDRRILKIEHLRFTINYKFIMTIFEAAKSLRAQTLPEKIDTLLVALMKDLATITNQVYERTFRSQQKEYRVFAMSITHAKLAVTKLISYIAQPDQAVRQGRHRQGRRRTRCVQPEDQPVGLQPEHRRSRVEGRREGVR